MRIWSLHPSYLDTKGLVALWREGLLALAVLQNKTVGYVNHPQLIRFKNTDKPCEYMLVYLNEILAEAQKRGFNFDKNKVKIAKKIIPKPIEVTSAQLDYEMKHLYKKLEKRAPHELGKLAIIPISCHPLFVEVPGPIEPWERT